MLIKLHFPHFPHYYFQEIPGNRGRHYSHTGVHIARTLMEQCGEGISCTCGATVEFHDINGKFHQPPDTLARAFLLPPQIAASAQCCALCRFGTVWCEYRTQENQHHPELSDLSDMCSLEGFGYIRQILYIH